MGLFNYVYCEAHLPDGWKPVEPLQTKAFDLAMDEYKITEDGRLLLLEYEMCETGEMVDLPWGGSYPAQERVNERWIDVPFHGVFNFYGSDNDVWHEYLAKFTDGNLVEITVDEERVKLMNEVLERRT